MSKRNDIFLSIVIPAYNEEYRIIPTLEQVTSYLDKQGRSYQIIVVNDGSADNTSEVVSRFFEKKPVGRLLEYFPNQGKGKAVREGVLASTGEFVLFMDADLSTPLEELEKGLLIFEEDSSVDVAIGSRYLNNSEINKGQPLYRQWGALLFKKVFYRIMGLANYSDTQCGFKLYRGSCARELFAISRVIGYMFDVEMLVLADKLHKKVKEFPVVWENDDDSRFRFFYDTARMFLHLAQIKYYTHNVGS